MNGSDNGTPRIHLGSADKAERVAAQRKEQYELERTYRYRSMVASIAGEIIASVVPLTGEDATSAQEHQLMVAEATVACVTLAEGVVHTAWRISPPEHFAL